MSQQKLDLQLRGLYLAPNNLSGVPQGALEIADNVVINSKSLIESRRGQTQYGDPLTIGSGEVNKIFNYSSSLIVNYDDKLAYDAGSGNWTDYSGTYNAPDAAYKMRSLEALKNFYFTTDQGIYKIDALTATPRAAGVVRALGGTGELDGAQGFLVADTAVAYRLVWGYVDANNNLILGAPSQRLIVQNPTGTDADVELEWLIPDTITTEYFYQIYRSNASATAETEPSDELQLVLQGNPTAGEITAKTFTVLDQTPYSLMRATLYTSPSQEGIANSNFQPPLALDMDVFKGCAFYANIRQRQNLSLALIGVGSPSLGYAVGHGDTTNTDDTVDGLQATASLVIQDLTYSAVTAGVSGNDVSIEYIGGGTAGAEVVTVDGSYIEIKIQSGVSTATQVKTAFDLVGAATALATCSISGAGGAAQVIAAEEVLSGGFDTTLLRVGMRVLGTGIPVNTVIVAIVSADEVTLSKNATATASNVTIEFQDRFTLGGVDYYAGSTQDVATNQFFVDETSTPAQNINLTAVNLIEVINTSTSNTTIYAYYISSVEDLPGQILFQERAIGGAAFSANSTAGSSFSPNLPTTNLITANTIANPTVVTSVGHGLTTGNSIVITGSNSTPTINGTRTVTVVNANSFTVPVNVTSAGTAGSFMLAGSLVESDNEVRQNRVLISKQGQIEAVPIYRFFDIGSANFPIQRVVALRDGIFFFKSDGIFRLSGETFESFSVALVDNTVTLKAPESAVPFNNQVFCFTTQGVCAVTDAGVNIISVPIENVLLELSSEQFTGFTAATFGVAYESARQYMLFTVSSEDDMVATQAFVYNSLTDSWTRWPMERTCGVVNTAVNKLFMAEADTGQMLIERKSYTNADYADAQFDVEIDSVDSATTVTMVSVTLIEEGMTLVQGNRQAFIEEINGLVLTVTSTQGFTADDAVVYTPILNVIQWSPIDVENPGILKQYSEISLFFRNAAFQEIDAGFATNVSPNQQRVPISNNFYPGAWGNFPWGLQPWGGQLGGQNVLRTYVPREKQMGSWLILSLRTEEAFTGFSLQGVSLIYEPMSSWIK